jgi:hypothetical protein
MSCLRDNKFIRAGSQLADDDLEPEGLTVHGNLRGAAWRA